MHKKEIVNCLIFSLARSIRCLSISFVAMIIYLVTGSLLIRASVDHYFSISSSSCSSCSSPHEHSLSAFRRHLVFANPTFNGRFGRGVVGRLGDDEVKENHLDKWVESLAALDASRLTAKILR